MGLFDFALIRRFGANLEQQIRKMEAELEQLRRQREAAIYAPASKEDLKTMLSSWVKSSGDKHRAALSEALTKFVRHPRNMSPKTLAEIVGITGVSQPLGDAVVPRDVDQALCALFGPLLNQALLEHVDSMVWPEGSLTSAQRAADAEKLSGQIDKLQLEVNDLIQSAEDAGITWDR